MEKYILAILLQPIFFLFTDAIISWFIYVCQEVNHAVRKAIRNIKYIFVGFNQ